MTRLQRASYISVHYAEPPPPSSFAGFPAHTLLESGKVPTAEIARLALREGQCSTPLYRVHRWFARRLGSQFRAILTALSLEPRQAKRFWDVYLGAVSLEGAIVLDPFVGGGTSLVEAGRCGASVIGYDIDPVATCITRFELEAATYDPTSPEINELCVRVAERIAPFHKTTVPGIGERVVLHHFWVECRTCNACGMTFEIHPHYQLAYSQEKGLQWVFCKDCHAVSELSITRKESRCGCGTRTRIAQGTLSQGKVQCPACSTVSGLRDRGDAPQRPVWRLFAQEYLEETWDGVTRHFKKATRGDRIRFERARLLLQDLEATHGSFAPVRAIPTNGRSDQRPLIHGITRYRDLFNDRQLLHMTMLGHAITGIEQPRMRRLLAMAFSEHLTTNCMYTAYAFGYRRLSPMFSIHSYRHITRPVEVNPWLNGIGRGTFPNVLGKIAKAVAFAKAPTELDPRGGRTSSSKLQGLFSTETTTDPKRVVAGTAKAAVQTKTSENLTELADGTVDLILTDPPYFDNLSYSELSDFYLAWHQSLGIAEPPYDDRAVAAPIKANLALTNRAGKSIDDYRLRLRRIFVECHRVLKSQGICVFTYHHEAVSAWLAVGEALARSGFSCTAVLPLRGEGRGGLHSYNGTIKWDAVFVCRKGKVPATRDDTEVMVERQAVAHAQRRADYFAKQLSVHDGIGFREPDRLNLQRALIVASATIDPGKGHRMRLRAALEQTKSQGERGHVKT
jgi:adenine-specific DNA methylase